MAKNYDSESIEVLSGLDPVRKRPGMYTDTSCPNHLIQEVLDNSIDEALAGHCSKIKVTLHKGGTVSVIDDGRGMPVDIHPEHQVSGVELIMCKLHAGAKFSGEDYNFSGGLHGVGVSVVNALSKKLSVEIKRDCHRFEMNFEGGEKTSDLKKIGDIGPRNTGTSINFVPDPQYFETIKIDKLIASMTSNPAKILEINKGSLDVGFDADLCVLNIKKPWVVKKNELKSKSKNTPIEDRKLQGQVMKTFVKGEILFERD